MDIYIGNLPSEISSTDLKKVVRSVLLPNNFRELVRQLVDRNERVSFSEIDVIENRMGEQSTHFAHAVVMPERAALRLLKRMDHLTFNGKSLRVRQYTKRNEANDRRNRQPQNLYAVDGYNRRQVDRREACEHKSGQISAG